MGEDTRQGPPEGLVRSYPREPARYPANRHMIATVAWKDRGDPKGRNTMIEPWVDVRADIDAINRGEAYCDRGRGLIWIAGRLYGTHTDRRTGTIFPISGDGFISITSAQHAALRTFARYNGDVGVAVNELSRNRRILSEDTAVARMLWQLRLDWEGQPQS